MVLTLDQALVPRSALALVLSTEGYLAKPMASSLANPKGSCWAMPMAAQRVAWTVASSAHLLAHWRENDSEILMASGSVIPMGQRLAHLLAPPTDP